MARPRADDPGSGSTPTALQLVVGTQADNPSVYNLFCTFGTTVGTSATTVETLVLPGTASESFLLIGCVLASGGAIGAYLSNTTNIGSNSWTSVSQGGVSGGVAPIVAAVVPGGTTVYLNAVCSANSYTCWGILNAVRIL